MGLDEYAATIVCQIQASACAGGLQSWRRLNPGWEIRFYDDEACVEFVSREFPEYLAAYRALPKHVERSDFFRYMVRGLSFYDLLSDDPRLQMRLRWRPI